MSQNVDEVCGEPGESNVASKGVNGGRKACKETWETSRVGGEKEGCHRRQFHFPLQK